LFEDPKFKKYLEYLSLGGEIAVAFSTPILVGYFFDVKFETSPWGVLSGVLLGILLMIGIFVRLIKNVSKN
jgi:F0F1-type ATP synthase assembly protein I